MGEAQSGQCVPPCDEDSSMGEAQSGQCVPPCDDASSMNDTQSSSDRADATTCAEVLGTGGTTPPTAAQGSGRPPAVLGVQAVRDERAGASSTNPVVRAATALLPNTGAGAALFAAAIGGVVLLLAGGVLVMRRRGLQS
jgi:LPXTG-motif cell wall-anchored protein